MVYSLQTCLFYGNIVRQSDLKTQTGTECAWLLKCWTVLSALVIERIGNPVELKMNFERKPFSNYGDIVMLLRRNSQA